MTNRKTARNDPCPCGSGKKYKQCCLPREGAQPARMEAMGAQVQRALHAAWMQRQQGNLAQAEGICQQILQAMPNQPDALNLAGAIALQQGNLEVSIPLLQRAIKANPRNPEYHNNLGLACHEMGEPDAAEKHYRKALALAPEYTDAAFNLHALLLDLSNLQSAIQCLQQVVKVKPLDNEARYTLGVLLDYGGDQASAAEHFARLEQGSSLDLARLDAWRYLKSACQPLPPITGCGLKTFTLALGAAPEDGMVLEFGVRFGTSIREIAALAKQPVHGFDSFEGLPEVWHHEPKGSYTTKGEIPKVPDNVSLHVGWFEDTLPAFLEQHAGPVRFVNVDCDIYSSTKTVLDLLASRMVAGSVIVFDEYIGNEHWREDEFKAFQEAVAKYGWSYEYLCFSIFTKQVVVRISSI
jgi:tetratricopeptide (TPR) repeat protein